MERSKLGFIVGIVALGGLVGIFTPMYFISNSDYDSLSGDYLELSADFESLWGDHQKLVENYSMLLSNYLLLSENYDVLLEDYQNLNTTYNALLEDYQNLNTTYNALLEDYQNLNTTYNALLEDYQNLNTTYNALLDDHQNLNIMYNALLDDHQLLQFKYDTLNEYISQQILPVQYSLFAEAVRRYYLDSYLEGLWELDEQEYWKAFVEYCRDVILHDSGQYNAFEDVSNAFSDALVFGNDTMYLSRWIMLYTIDYCNTINFWELDELTGLDNLLIIYNVVQDCINNINYEYDSDITLGQTYFEWDYIKFPVETAFRTMGDCEDQAILCAAYLESCGLETAIAISHDPNHPTYDAFYHGSLLVHIEDTVDFDIAYPDGVLWNLGDIDPYVGYTWCFLDPTWDVSFGDIPLWLQDYIDLGLGIADDIMSVAICDIDGAIGENIGLECFLPT